jgi:sRNA-binding carbon storage regulator CsrA
LVKLTAVQDSRSTNGTSKGTRIMLVLSRHVAKPANNSEHVVITATNGEVIRVYYLGQSTAPNSVKLGFEGPDTVNFLRSELERNQE